MLLGNTKSYESIVLYLAMMLLIVIGISRTARGDCVVGRNGHASLRNVGPSPTRFRSSRITNSRPETKTYTTLQSPSPEESLGRVREVIPEKYRKRYERWKNEFLSTDIDRRQWERYAYYAPFTLTITVSCEKRSGATTGEFRWTERGELINATITLGCHIDEASPPTDYYPVTGSLGSPHMSYLLGYSSSKKILAATKIAHEFGHVIDAYERGDLDRRLNQLIDAYDMIFLSNGHNIRDAPLVEIEQEMGGMPMQIWQFREYSAEANALLYVQDKSNQKTLPASLLNLVARNIESSANKYTKRFCLAPLLPAALSACGEMTAQRAR